MRLNNLNASEFADKVNVQRSGLSHIFSGRNKPSLDLILKIVEKFPDVNLEWLLMGKGEYVRKEMQSMSSDKNREKTEGYNSNSEPTFDNNKDYNNKHDKNDLKKERIEDIDNIIEEKTKDNISDNLKSIEGDYITHVMYFYNDGTFRRYRNRDKE